MTETENRSNSRRCLLCVRCWVLVLADVRADSPVIGVIRAHGFHGKGT